LLARRHGPVVVDRAQDVVKLLVRVGLDLDLGVAGIDLAFAELYVFDDVAAGASEDFVEDLGEEKGIDDMALQFDFFDERFRLRHGTPPASIVPKTRWRAEPRKGPGQTRGHQAPYGLGSPVSIL